MEALSQNSPEEALTWFHDKVLDVLEVKVPKKKPKKSFKGSKMHRMRKLLWKRLAKVDNKMKAASTMHKKAKLLQQRWDLEKQLADDFLSVNNSKEDDAVLRIKENPKAFYSFARSRLNTKSRVGPFMDPATGSPNSSPDYCCHALQQQYESVFAAPRPEWKVDSLEDHFKDVGSISDSISDISFSKTDIEKACLQLSSSSAAGPDGVPAVLLKTCRRQLSLPLYHLWRGSLDSGTIPAETLLVIICPIHKGGSRSLPK